MTRALRVWATTATPGATQLRAGRDLVLETTAMDAVRVPEGVLLDDHLVAAEREAVEERARAATARWREANRAALLSCGVDLGWIWEVELYRDALLPLERMLAGLRAAVTAIGPAAVELHGLDPATARAAAWAVEPLPASVRDPAPRLDVRSDAPTLSRAQRLLVASGVGAPQLIRGDLRAIHHWVVAPALDVLVERSSHAPVLDVAGLPPVGPRELARLAWRGGWLGAPGAVRRRRSARRVGSALAALTQVGSDPAAALRHARAAQLLAERALPTGALVERNERAFARGRIRLAVVPFDSLASVRAVLAAARRHGVPSLLVQHGYAPEPHDPDKGQVDHVAAWSARDAAEVGRRFGRPATVTGNPAAPPALAPRRPRLRGGGCTLALVQSPTLYSIRWGLRVSQRFVELALAALARARPGGRVILRPHPMEPNPRELLRLVPAAVELQVEVDAHSPIGDLIDRCDLCVGGVSTATLQAAVAGLPVAFLDVTDSPSPAPFDGARAVPAATGADTAGGAIPAASGDQADALPPATDADRALPTATDADRAVPAATDADGLAEAIAIALADGGVAGVAQLAEALGVVPGAPERLADLISELAAPA